MADRITLNFAANTSEVEQGTDRIADSLDDVDRKLEDVGTAGEQAGQAASDGLDDVGASATDVSGELGDLASIATDVLEGDVAGAARTAADTLGGMAAIIPGIGAAIGSGLAFAANALVDVWETATKQVEDRVASMYEDMKESGDNFASNQFIAGEVDAILNDAARLDAARATSELTGARLALVLRAEAGDQVAINSVLREGAAAREALTAAQDDYIEKNGDSSAAIEDQLSSLDVLAQTYGYIGDEQDTAAAKANLYREATEGVGTATGNLADKLNDLPGTVVVGIEVDTDAADTDVEKFITRVRNRRIRIPVEGVDRYGRRID